MDPFHRFPNFTGEVLILGLLEESRQQAEGGSVREKPEDRDQGAAFGELVFFDSNRRLPFRIRKGSFGALAGNRAEEGFPR